MSRVPLNVSQGGPFFMTTWQGDSHVDQGLRYEDNLGLIQRQGSLAIKAPTLSALKAKIV